MAAGDGMSVEAVLTGDVVRSSALTSDGLARVRRLVGGVGRDLTGVEADAVVTHDWYRGDGWEMVVRPGWLALRAALLARARLRAMLDVDTRVTIGVGPSDDPARAAFIRSGRRLESLARDDRMGFAGPDPHEATAWDAAMGMIDDTVAARWTPRRAIAMMGALRGWTQARTGRLYRPRITQATVGEHLERAGWSGLKRVLAAYEGRWRAGSGG